MRFLPFLLALVLFIAPAARADDSQHTAGTATPPPPQPSTLPEARSALPEAPTPPRPSALSVATMTPRPSALPDATTTPGATNRLAPPPPPTLGPIAVQRPPDDRVYYGLILAPFDVVAGALVVGGIIVEAQGNSNDSSSGAALLVTGLATYAVGPPIVHLARGNPGKGALDLLLRTTAPVMSALLGGALGVGVASGLCNQNNTCTIDALAYGAAGGFAIGTITSLMVDYVVLANDPAGSAAAHRVARPTAWSPYATPIPSGAAIGLVGVF